MLAKRLIALLAAVALVAGALWLRSRRDGDGEPASPTTSAGSTGATTTAAGSPVQLVCIEELAEACTAAAPGAVVEPAGTTIDRLATERAPAPTAWVTVQPLPALVDELRAREGLEPLFADVIPVASSPLVLVGRADQMAVLTAHCGGTLTWTCLGEVAGTPWSSIGGPAAWGDVKPAHADASSSAVGLLSFAAAVVDRVGRADLATVDLEADDVAAWIRRLERSIPTFGGPQGTPFQQLLLLPSVNVVGTTEAEVEATAGARRGGLAVAYPGPMAQADVVLATSAGVPADEAARLADAIGTEAQARGWKAPSTPPPGSLPPPGVLQALRQAWTDVVR